MKLAEKKIFQLGWIDSCVFIHPFYPNDSNSGTCARILRLIQEGQAEAWIDPITIHELTYALTRKVHMPPEDVFRYLSGIIVLDNVHVDGKEIVLHGLKQWSDYGKQFADARIISLAQKFNLPVCSVNAKHFNVPGLTNTFLSTRDAL